MSYIEFEHINKHFGPNHVLKNIRLTVNKGDFVTLLGPSGCGKSTLLRCLAGLEDLTSGKIFLDGEDITAKEARDRNAGMIFQQYSLFPNMNVFDNIGFGLKMKRVHKEERFERVKKAIQLVELGGKEKQYASQLSGGQQQRVALARAIVMEPKVLLLDEPLSAIDAKLRRSLQASIKEIHKELGITSIFVTHDQDEAMIMSDVIHLFHNGTIEQSGSPVDMYTAPKTSFAAGFIGHYNLLSNHEFFMISGSAATRGGEVAIRPETIELSVTPFAETDKAYQFEAVIQDNTLRGNVLRYTIEVSGIVLKVDMLFRSFQLFDNGSRVYVSVDKHNCLQL